MVTVILACVQLISCIFFAFTTDKFGYAALHSVELELTDSRRPLTVYGYAVTVAAVLALGIVGFFDYRSPALGALLIFFASIAIFCE